MEPMQPPEPTLPSPPRSTPLAPPTTPPPPGGFPGWGAAPGAARPPYAMPFAPVARTHSMATAALVCGLVGLATFWIFGIVPLLAIIFGLISVRTIRASNGTLRGLGMARAGWILGLIGLAGAGVFFWAGLTGRLDDESTTTTPPSLDSFLEADVGDCVATVPEGDVVLELDYVSCEIAHAAEVYVVGDLNPTGTREFPGEDAVLTAVETACSDGFAAYVGRSYETSVFEVFYLYPRRLGWKSEGGGDYYCMLGEVGKTTVGSAFQSDR